MDLGGVHHGGALHGRRLVVPLDWPRLVVLLKSVTLHRLLILKLLFRVFVALQDLVVLDFAQLESLVHLSLQFFAQRIHLVLLLLHQLCLSCQDLLVPSIHVCLTLLLLNLVSPNLHLVRLLIVLLLCKILLDLAQVEQLSRKLEGQGERLLKVVSVILELLGVARLEIVNLLLVLALRLLELDVVVAVEVLVLLDVRLLDLLLLLLVLVAEALVLHGELLLFQLLDAVLGHFSL